jgi:hypothetical protein
VKPAVPDLVVAAVRIIIWSKEMTESKDMITVHVNVEITVASLQTIVENHEASIKTFWSKTGG